MKRIIFALLLIPSIIYSQGKYGHTPSSSSSSGITVVTAREKTGWTSDGTTAQDTLATTYRLDKANIRFIVTDADGDTLWFHPQNLLPFVLKDGATILAAIDSTGRAGFGTLTSGQARRALLNIVGRAVNDTLLAIMNDVVGTDSSLFITNGNELSVEFKGPGQYRFYPGTGSNTFQIVHQNGTFYYGGKPFTHQKSSGISLRNSANYTAEIKQSIAFITRNDAAGNAYAAAEIAAGRETGTSGNNSGFISFYTTSYDGSVNAADERMRITSRGYLGIGTTTPRAVLSIDKSALADTLFMASNDANATLDSTFMVFPTGRISRTDAKALPAAGWAGTAANAPALDTVAYIVGYQFDKATAETLTVDFELPSVFSTISSINVEVINPNTAGDSVAFSVAWLGRADGEDMTVAFSSALSDTIDLGTIKDARKILTIAGSFTNLAANDRLILKLWRDPSISNDVDSDVFLTEVKVNGVGLLR